MLVPAELYDLLVRLLDEHGMAGPVEAAVKAAQDRDVTELRAAAAELGLELGAESAGTTTDSVLST